MQFDVIFPFIITAAIAFIMGILGAMGVFSRIGNRLTDISSRLLPSHSDDIPKDFRYKEIEIGARVSDEGFVWDTMRKAKIISLTKNLKDIEVGVRTENIETDAKYSVAPKQFSILKPDASTPTSLSQKATKFLIQTNTPIKKYRSAEFVFRYSFKKIRSLRTEQLFWASSTREVETLKLRLILFDDRPVKVFREILNTLQTRELSSEQIEADPFTHEYLWTITRPRKDRVYSLTWITEMKNNGK